MVRRLLVIFFVFLLLFAAVGSAAGEETGKVPKKVLRLTKAADKAFDAQDYDKALELYEKAIELAPGFAPPYMGKAQVLQVRKDFAGAQEYMEKAYQLQPGNSQSRRALENIFLALGKDAVSRGQLAESNEYFLKILALPGAEELDQALAGDLYYQLGVNYFNLKKYEESKNYFTKFTGIPGLEEENSVQYIVSNYMLGLNYNRLEKLDESNKYLEKFLELHEKNPAQPPLVPLAHFLLGSNLFQVLDKKIQGQKNADVKSMHALARENGEIATHLEKAIELKQDLEDAYLKLGNYYYYCGYTEKAIGVYESLVEKFPASPDIESYKRFLQQLKDSQAAKK